MNPNSKHQTNHILLNVVDSKSEAFEQRVESKSKHDYQWLATVWGVDIIVMVLGLSFEVFSGRFFMIIKLSDRIWNFVTVLFSIRKNWLSVMVVFIHVQVSEFMGIWTNKFLKSED